MINSLSFWLFTIFAGIIATAVMTLFTWIMCTASGKKVAVIPIFTKVLAAVTGKPASGSVLLIARFLHYLIGVLFSLGFELLVALKQQSASFYAGLVYGIVCGILAVVFWSIAIYNIKDAVPREDRKFYLLTIWLGHLMFSETLVLLHLFQKFV